MGLENTVIVVGTYEEFVLGYKISKLFKTKDEYELELSFTQKAHIGPVRSIVGVNKFIVSGGSDDMCKVVDMSKRVESGVLNHHEGTVSCLTGFGKKFLLTGSDDNSLSILRVGSWQIEKTLYKHTAGITCLAVHPTGKLAFTAGKDKKLITWNLVKARPAFITNIKGIADLIVVSPDGSRYCVGIHRRIDIYNLETAGIEYTIELKCRPNALVFLTNQIVVVAGESSKVQVHSLVEKELIKEFEAHETRVRCLDTISQDTDADSNESTDLGHVLITASSSDHLIKMWRLKTDKESQVTCIGSVDTTCRVTCLTQWNPTMKGRSEKKRKNKQPAATSENGTITPPKKKIKFTESSKEEEVRSEEAIVVEQEINDRNANKQIENNPEDIAKIKKKKKKKTLKEVTDS